MSSFRRYLPPVIYFSLAVFFTWLYNVRYWKYRDCIEEALSSCQTPDGATLIAGGQWWGIVAMMLAFRGLVLLAAASPMSQAPGLVGVRSQPFITAGRDSL